MYQVSVSPAQVHIAVVLAERVLHDADTWLTNPNAGISTGYLLGSAVASVKALLEIAKTVEDSITRTDPIPAEEQR